MILTHCARLKDFNHTSWAEIRAFYEICSMHRIVENIELRDYQELNQTVYTSDLTIFAAGDKMHPTIVDLANNCRNLYIVIQDPNWPTSLHQINREFRLITPFQSLKDLTLEEAKSILKKNIPTLKADRIISHSLINFGDMMAYNTDYANLYYSNMRKSDISTVKDRTVYVGSLKKDRIESLANYAKSNRIDFFGNFTEEDFLKMSGLRKDDLLDARFMGRTKSPFEVSSVYQRYFKVLFAPDDKISDLDTSYIRFAEMCLAKARVESTSNRADVKKVLDDLTDDTGRLNWSNFVNRSRSSNLISQIRKAYSEKN